MAEQVSFTQQPRVRIGAGAVILVVLGVAIWYWVTAGRESTDDAQVDAHVTQIAARVGGTVLRQPDADNQQVNSGDVLVEIDPRDYQEALDIAGA
jgi:membrane fusion protein (multidrug efflux system)